MTVAFPAHLVETMGSAAASGVEAAGHLLQEAGHTVSSAAENTSKRARKLARMARNGGRQRRVGGNLVVVAVLAGVAVLAVALGRALSGRPHEPAVDDLAADKEGNLLQSPTAEAKETAGLHTTDMVKADKVKADKVNADKVKEAAG